MVSQRKVPRHWNAYRPSYEIKTPPRPQQGPPTRPPAGFEAQIRAATSFSRGQGPPLPSTSNTGTSTSTNPNLIPVPSRRDPSHHSSSSEVNTHGTRNDLEEGDRNTGPHLWDPELDKLIGRTTRAYDLVINYERDSHGGERWSRADIARIHDAGKDLHNDIGLLRSWKRDPSAEQEQDLIRMDAKNVKKLCEYMQRVISETEKKTCEEWKEARMQGWARAVDEGVKEEMEYERGAVHEYGERDESVRYSYARSADRVSHRWRRSSAEQRERQARGTDSYRPNRAGFAGQLGSYTLHY